MSQAVIGPDDAARRQVIESPSYGAAFFNWIYLIAMRAWAHALVAIVLTALFWPLAWIVYGIFGKRIAWTSRQWRDFDEFLAVQRAWTRWAVVWTVVIGAFMLVGFALRLILPAWFHPRLLHGPSI
jgi:hypothetical protein